MLYLIGKSTIQKISGYEEMTDLPYSKMKVYQLQKKNKKKKQLQSLFKQKALQIIIECNLKVVNYLDVTFNLNDGSYRPCQRPNNETHYIHIQSDYPSSITKQPPRSIEKHLSQLSSSKIIFYEKTPYYE